MHRTSAKAPPRAWIIFDEQVAEGSRDLRPGDEIVVLTYTYFQRCSQADRDHAQLIVGHPDTP